MTEGDPRVSVVNRNEASVMNDIEMLCVVWPATDDCIPCVMVVVVVVVEVVVVLVSLDLIRCGRIVCCRGGGRNWWWMGRRRKEKEKEEEHSRREVRSRVGCGNKEESGDEDGEKEK
ncbi:hypothetical protein E2C01_005091 [Portunus trituberculatus]|uniref:Transmembrane protein n=1 Tax=Portunus trituberculatus TaxID=210409 RepID=A0A5B7CU27_PORTR|nr:hypothetical protein [Portunus trituberculatus]